MSLEAQLIGLDVGTSSCKAGLFDARGELLALATAAYRVERPQPGWAEQNPEDYWTAAVRCLRELLASPQADRSRLAALASCGQTPTLVLLDHQLRPIRPAILWQDTRAVAEAEALARDPGTDTLAVWMGLRWPVDASQPLARLLWLRTHEPEVVSKVATVLLPKDLVHLRLTGRPATDAWSAKGLVHQATRQPVEALETLGGLPLSAIPPALPSTGTVGKVSPAGAAATDLPVGLPVVAGWTDALAAMLGTGSLGRAGLASDVSGTSEVIGLTLDRRPPDSGPLIAAGILDSGRWTLYGPTQTSGGALGWALRALAPALSVEQALIAAAEAPPGAGGLVFLPYLEGERAPLWDPRARGAFAGLTGSHTTAHLLRAVLEGVACSVRHVLIAAEVVGSTTAQEVRVAGGGARLALWNQIKADVTGRLFCPCAVSENGVLGAAMLAALGVGLFPDAAAAGNQMVRLGAPVSPHAAHRAVYDRLYDRYVALYPRLREIIH